MHKNPCLAIALAATVACAPFQESPPDNDAGEPARSAVRDVAPTAETPPVETAHDAADDPAIWVNPDDPRLSVVIGTDKQRGLHVYDLDGELLQTLPDGRMNNVDLRDGFEFEGRSQPLVAATNRSNRAIALYLLDPESRRLRAVGEPIKTGFRDPYGLCMYAASDGEFFVFASEADSGRFRQWRIRAQGTRLVAEHVREFRVGSQAEGCVADDETGALYVAEEDRALWEYRADPDGGSTRREIDRVGGAHGLKADLEGVSLWLGSGGRGFVVLSNQGAHSYAVYRRGGDHAFVGLFRIVDNGALGIDGVSETDGLAVVSQPLGERYPEGLLVVQDGSNQPAGQFQNFKYVSWRDIRGALAVQ